MYLRKNKESEAVVKMAIHLALNRHYSSAEQLMSDAGISPTVIERVLYDPNNIRQSDLTTSIN